MITRDHNDDCLSWRIVQLHIVAVRSGVNQKSNTHKLVGLVAE